MFHLEMFPCPKCQPKPLHKSAKMQVLALTVCTNYKKIICMKKIKLNIRTINNICIVNVDNNDNT